MHIRPSGAVLTYSRRRDRAQRVQPFAMHWCLRASGSRPQLMWAVWLHVVCFVLYGRTLTTPLWFLDTETLGCIWWPLRRTHPGAHHWPETEKHSLERDNQPRPWGLSVSQQGHVPGHSPFLHSQVGVHRLHMAAFSSKFQLIFWMEKKYKKESE